MQCPCGRWDKPIMAWCCPLCYMQKEIAYALYDLGREGDVWSGYSWYNYAVDRLRELRDME